MRISLSVPDCQSPLESNALGFGCPVTCRKLTKPPARCGANDRSGRLCQLRGQKSGEMCLLVTRYKDHFSQQGAGLDTVGNYLRDKFVMAVCACVRVIRAALTIHGEGGFRFRAL